MKKKAAKPHLEPVTGTGFTLVDGMPEVPKIEKVPHGIIPFEFKVLILPNKVSKMTKGGIERPETVVDQMQTAVSKGRLVAVSPFAFTYFDNRFSTYDEVVKAWPGTPKIGDMVLYGRYCGGQIMGDDGVNYRIMNDKDVMALISEGVSEREIEYE